MDEPGSSSEVGVTRFAGASVTADFPSSATQVGMIEPTMTSDIRQRHENRNITGNVRQVRESKKLGQQTTKSPTYTLAVNGCFVRAHVDDDCVKIALMAIERCVAGEGFRESAFFGQLVATVVGKGDLADSDQVFLTIVTESDRTPEIKSVIDCDGAGKHRIARPVFGQQIETVR